MGVPKTQVGGDGYKYTYVHACMHGVCTLRVHVCICVFVHAWGMCVWYSAQLLFFLYFAWSCRALEHLDLWSPPSALAPVKEDVATCLYVFKSGVFLCCFPHQLTEMKFLAKRKTCLGYEELANLLSQSQLLPF